MARRGRSLIFRAFFGLAISALSLSVAGAPARAGFFNFDPDGMGPLPSSAVGGLDFSVGDALGRGMIDAINGKAPTFQMYYQATLAGYINSNGVTIVPDGLNTKSAATGEWFQITAVAGVTEQVVGTGVTSDGTGFNVNFRVVDLPSNFLQVFYHPVTVDAGGNPTNLASTLNGTNFASLGSGWTRILSSSPSSGDGNLQITLGAGGSPVIDANLDHFGANDYPGIKSVMSKGTTVLNGVVDQADSKFFTSPFPFVSLNFTNVTAFGTADPSRVFTGLSGGSFVDITPNFGTENGNYQAASPSPDFIFQADGSLAPEPSGALLLGVGLVGLLALRWGRRLPGPSGG